VAVATVEFRPEVVQRKWDLAGCVRAVHDGDDVTLARTANQLLHGQNQGGRRGDVADDEHSRPLRHARPDLFHHLCLVARRQADRLRTVDRADLFSKKAPCTLDRSVLVVRPQGLITFAQQLLQGARDDVRPMRGVGDEDQIISPRA
jgi:hypothetical protein